MTGNADPAARSGSRGDKSKGPNRREELIALSAFIVSLASLFIAYQESQATKRLVQASSLPYLTFVSTFDQGPDLRATGVTRMIENDGVGPADIRYARLTFNHRQYSDIGLLLHDCCVIAKPQTTASLTNRMIRPGTSVTFLVVKEQRPRDGGTDRFARLVRSGAIGLTICYCSVFEDCWMLNNSANARPEPIKMCPLSGQATERL